MDKFDLGRLEQLLATMEPGEIRDRYAEQLASSHECRIMLDHFEAMDGYLSELKVAAGQPPAIRFPKKSSRARFLPWALPLAAAMVIGVLIFTRTLPDEQSAVTLSEIDTVSLSGKDSPDSLEARTDTDLSIAPSPVGDDRSPEPSNADEAPKKEKAEPVITEESFDTVSMESLSPPAELEKKDVWVIETEEARSPMPATRPEPEKSGVKEALTEQEIEERDAGSAPVEKPGSADRDDRNLRSGEANRSRSNEEGKSINEEPAGARQKQAKATSSKSEDSPPAEVQDGNRVLDGTSLRDGEDGKSSRKRDQSLTLGIKALIRQLESAWNSGRPLPEGLFSQEARIHWRLLGRETMNLPAATRVWAEWTGRDDRPGIVLEEPAPANGLYLVKWRTQGSRGSVTGTLRIYLDAQDRLLRIEE